MTVKARYAGEDLEVWFEAETERSDYGVERSPVWEELIPSSVKIASLEILGVEVDHNTLPAALQQAIHDIWDELEFE